MYRVLMGFGGGQPRSDRVATLVPTWIVLLGAVACTAGPDSGGGEPVARGRAPLSGVIPTSVTCPYQVVSGGCFAVPPKPINCLGTLSCNPAFDGSIDGVRSPHEYDGATELPYTDQRYRAEAKVYVRAFKDVGVR